ncbi:hypothetical protein FRZ67_08050 [Panacibacter ginsenosidivorans]|uniref:Uncharacterized protein n=1 Tax=Panacibacter ginsenosidivorans TaxID=1813871 RepID=A0A5B8VAB5_9BACT|nr:hypothetical protein [Panacibacter ginsenosidivorans]QEC67248.1 hypothetical protein FRZ67_08050 [Panacibacter ginsenosidivorans]
MTFEEKQDYDILKLLVDNNGYLNYWDFISKASEAGVGLEHEITEEMKNRGLIEKGMYFVDDIEEQGNRLTTAGRNKYNFLVEQMETEKRNEKIAKWTFWIVIIGTIAAILSVVIPLL